MPYTSTYRELLAELSKLSEDELDGEITVERLSADGEHYFATIETAGPKHHEFSNGHLIIYVQDIED